jgi:hypothetical protein
MEKDFSKWFKWSERDQLPGLKHPGVYILAISSSNIGGQPFRWSSHVKYIGMTNSQGGLKSRLRQFDNTIRGKEGHGGACRFRYKHKLYGTLAKKLYVCVRPVECDVKSFAPKDLMAMAEVAKLEYVCFAEYSRRFKGLPEFNDKKLSKKG